MAGLQEQKPGQFGRVLSSLQGRWYSRRGPTQQHLSLAAIMPVL